MAAQFTISMPISAEDEMALQKKHEMRQLLSQWVPQSQPANAVNDDTTNPSDLVCAFVTYPLSVKRAHDDMPDLDGWSTLTVENLPKLKWRKLFVLPYEPMTVDLTLDTEYDTVDVDLTQDDE